MTSRIGHAVVLAFLCCGLSTANAQLHHFRVELAGGGNIGTQRAGTAFAVRITAQQANNTTYTAFTGKAVVTSSGTLTAGGDSTAKFVAGVLTSHSVTFGSTGTVTLTAANVVTGSSNAFSVIAFRSDDFNATNLNTRFWTFTDPLGDASFYLAGTKTANAQLAIAVPGGVAHDLYTGRNTAPRVMQACANADFAVNVKFDSPLFRAYQVQGVIVQASATTLLRFDFSSDGVAIKAFAASTVNGFATDPVVQIPFSTVATGGAAPLYMRVTRVGNVWTMLYSSNGTSYLTAGSFTFTMAVTQIGAFAGNAGTIIPPHTALVDFFFDEALPVTPEDGGTVADSLPPMIYDLTSVAGGTDIRVTWKTDERSKTRLEYGKTTSYGTAIVDDTLRTSHAIMLRSLTNNTRYNFRVIATDSTGRATTTANQRDTTYAKTPTVFTSWYTGPLTFGKLGTPQRFVNILGNVTDPVGLDTVSYRLNGGAPVVLTLGPDSRRLQKPGDFNIDLTYSALQAGSNTVLVTTKNIFGEQTTNTITVIDSSKRVWPLPVTVAMSSAKSLTDSVQVVDGRWTVSGGAAQIQERGYDRILAIGDTAWKDYDAVVRLKVMGLDTSLVAYAAPSNGPGIGLLMRWAGHTNDPNPGRQPLEGYLPIGASATLSWTSLTRQKWEMFGNNLRLRDAKSAPVLQLDTMYLFRMQVMTLTGQGGFYRFKVWKASQVEPAAWLMSAQESLTDPQYGSMLIVAHHVSCSIDHVSVGPIPQDLTAPQLSGISKESAATSAYITCATDEPARVRISYGTTTGYGKTAFVDTVKRTDHALFVTGLTPSTTYHYSIEATDNAGNTSTTADATFSTAAPATPTTLVADDFVGTSLHPRWTVTDPAGDAAITTPDTTVRISLPAGVVHDLWTNGYGVPRLMQSVNNTDFMAQVKWNSALIGTATSYRFQGIVVQQDQNNLIRFDFASADYGLTIFSASFRNGFMPDSLRIRVNTVVPGGAGVQPLHMRVIREGNIWSVWHSLSGVVWTLASQFYHPLVVSGVGLYAGNTGSAPPLFASVVDYFHTTLTTTDVQEAPAARVPASFALEQNFPNPFNPETVFEYHVPVARRVEITVFDVLGREVAVLVNEVKAPGTYRVSFKGEAMASGTYFCRMRAGDFVQVRKILLMK
jgi:hypothetical protein